MISLKYYIHDLNKNAYYVANDFDKMIEWFARYNKNKPDYYSWYNQGNKGYKIPYQKHNYKEHNKILNEVNLTGSDLGINYDFEKGYSYYVRPIIVKDEMGRIIDPRIYWFEIANFEFPTPKRYSWRRNKHPYEFRKDPVPGTRRRRYGHYYIHVKTQQERRIAADLEIESFLRGSRNVANLPTLWDDKVRFSDRCWKNKKVKKQWMKNLK